MIRSQVLICGGTGCTSSGSMTIQTEFEKALEKYNLTEEIKLVRTGCFGLCALGPVVIIYPDGTFYSRVSPEDVDEIVEGVMRVMAKAPEQKNGEDGLPIPPYKVYNIGNSNPENLLDFVQILSEELVRAKVLPEDYDFEAHKKLVPMQAGDVPVTYADTSELEKDFGFKPHTTLRDGLRKFAEWYYEYYIEKK